VKAINGINYEEVSMTSVSFDDNRLSSSCSATTYSSLNSNVSIELSVRVKRDALNVSLYGA